MKAITGVVEVDGVKVRRVMILEDRLCEICGKSFTPERIISRYCSRRCGKIADCKIHAEKYRERARRWREENPERAKKNVREYYLKNREKIIAQVKLYKQTHRHVEQKSHDKVRHGGKRAELIQKNGLVCSKCGKAGDRFSIVAHHKNFDPTDHSEQELLCRACHCKEHHERKKETVCLRNC